MKQAELLYLAFSYLVGTILSAYLLARFRGIDITREGSGNPGARNTLKVMGKGAFIFVSLFDGGKGILAVQLGRALGFSETIVAAGLLLAILGHMFPFWKRFRGGKGIATFFGGAFFLQPLAFLSFAVATLIFVPIMKSATLGMVFGYGAFVGYLLYADGYMTYFPVVIAIAVILYRHRFDLKESYDRVFRGVVPKDREEMKGAGGRTGARK
ncbi:MAG TPA: glycerol-3-phosphate acyltransferase [Clostridiaceae bacterium]|nr:glycerol-3-phosphate acyltransferase [Clostridiaceae bacterium]